MRNRRLVLLSFAYFVAALMLSAPAMAQPPLLVESKFFGGANNQRGTGIARDGTDIYLVGYDEAASLSALSIKYLTTTSTVSWFNALAGNTYFNGGAFGGGTLYGVGGALPPACGASDGVGGTEHKSALARYDTAGGLLGCGSPNYFGYRGGEGYYGALYHSASVYVVGSAENCGFGHTLFTLTKYAGGALVGQATEPAAGCIGGSFSSAIADLNGNLYLVGGSNLVGLGEDGFGPGGFMRPVIMKYTTALARLWRVRVGDVGHGDFWGVTAFGGAVYAVGRTYAAGVPGSSQYLIEKYDEAGNRVWTMASGGAGTDDMLTGVVGLGSKIYAVGWTVSAGAGGRDAVILEIDPATGNTLSSTLFGGAQDDQANGVATDGSKLFVVGESRSFLSAAGNAVGQNDIFLNTYNVLNVGPPGPPGPPGPQGPMGPSGSQTWDTFLGILRPAYTASQFRPDTGITVTRIQAQAVVPPLGCTVHPVITISDGVVSQSLTVTAAQNDSGPLNLNFAAGVQITLRVSTAANCIGGTPAAASVVVQYKSN